MNIPPLDQLTEQERAWITHLTLGGHDVHVKPIGGQYEPTPGRCIKIFCGRPECAWSWCPGCGRDMGLSLPVSKFACDAV